MEAIDTGGHYPGKGSTGPRTAEGKARVSRNALKHGLRAQKHVFMDEDADGFQEYRIELMHELAPIGTVETHLADRIAQMIWRLKRIMPLESEMMDKERTRDGAEPCPAGEVFARPSYHGPRGIALILRYETGLDRGLSRALKELRQAKAERLAAEAGAMEARALAPFGTRAPLLRAVGEQGASPPGALSEGRGGELVPHPEGPHPGAPSPGLTGRPLHEVERGQAFRATRAVGEQTPVPSAAIGTGPLQGSGTSFEPVDGRWPGESPAQWAARTLSKEQVETMIRDGWYVPPAYRAGGTQPEISKQSSPAPVAADPAIEAVGTSGDEAAPAKAAQKQRRRTSKQSSRRGKSGGGKKARPAASSGAGKGKGKVKVKKRATVTKKRRTRKRAKGGD